jgi:hypothetical protein
MDKWQAQDRFWNSFGIPAYDMYTVPTDAQTPYITYEYAEDNLDNNVFLSGSIWYNSTSWVGVSGKAAEIAEYIGNGIILNTDEGHIYVTRGTPFMQRLTDTDDSVRRIYINLQVEYITLN